MSKRKPPAAIAAVLDTHETWVRSNFRRGTRALLIGADLEGLNLTHRNLSGARLQHANLRNTILVDTIFHGSNLNGADLTGARMFDTVFRRVDLRSVVGLGSIDHVGPSTIGIDTLLRSKGQVPESFLRGCGVPSKLIRQLLEWAQRSELLSRYYSVFISYGQADEPFADALYRALEGHGVDAFFFPADATPGQRLHRLLRVEVNSRDRVLLVCSRGSLHRNGVLNEIEEVLAREARMGGGDILIPLRLDDYVFKEWAPDRPDVKQAVLDKVIADFAGAADSRSALHSAVKRLLPSLERAARPAT